MLKHFNSVSLPELTDAQSLWTQSTSAKGLDCETAATDWDRTSSTRTDCADKPDHEAYCGVFRCDAYSPRTKKPLLEGPSFYAVVTVVPIVMFLLIVGLIFYCMQKRSKRKEQAKAQKNIEPDGVTVVGDNDSRWEHM